MSKTEAAIALNIAKTGGKRMCMLVVFRVMLSPGLAKAKPEKFRNHKTYVKTMRTTAFSMVSMATTFTPAGTPLGILMSIFLFVNYIFLVFLKFIRISDSLSQWLLCDVMFFLFRCAIVKYCK